MEGINTFPRYVRHPLRNLWQKNVKKSSSSSSTLQSSSSSSSSILQSSSSSGASLPGNADEASQLYRNALQVLTDSKCMPLDENVMEKMIDLAELLHLVGRGKEDRELLEECFFATEKHKGKQYPSLVTHLVSLATSYSYLWRLSACCEGVCRSC
ncbi:hypothetical protein ACSBR2_025882 [Camellia fascicularis]